MKGDGRPQAQGRKASTLARARAVIVAAGSSRRMAGSGGARKPLIELGDRTLLEHVLATFDRAARIDSIVILAHADDLEAVRALVERLATASPTNTSRVRAVLPGGAERADSVRIGSALQLDDERAALVCIHDAARPFVDAEEVDRVVEAAARDGAALLALPVRDTLKHSEQGLSVDATVDRSALWAAQTPQVFERERFLECLARARRSGWSPTDDSALWERYVGPVTIVRGRATNLKITEGEDLELARAIVALRAGKVGTGGAS